MKTIQLKMCYDLKKAGGYIQWQHGTGPPSQDGKKVYGKFACIIGQYMKKVDFS